MHREDIDPYSTAIVEDLLSVPLAAILPSPSKSGKTSTTSSASPSRRSPKSSRTRASVSTSSSVLSSPAPPKASSTPASLSKPTSRTYPAPSPKSPATSTPRSPTRTPKPSSRTTPSRPTCSTCSPSKALPPYPSKLDVDEVKSIIDKQSGAEFKGEIQALSKKFEDLQHSTAKKFQQVPSMKDFSTLAQAVEMKANLQEMTEVLETKATKH